MLQRARALSGRLRHEDWVDLGLATLMAAVGSAASYTSSFDTGNPGAAVAWGLLEMAPLAVRRRFPLAVWLTVLVLICAEATATGSNEGAGIFFGLLVGAYTLAAHTPRPTAIAGLALLPPVVGYTSWRSTGNPFDDTFFVVALMGGFWIAGRVVWSRTQLVRRLAEQSEELRRGRDAEARAVVAEQRERMARDVHDVIAHSISIMVVQAEAGEAQLATDGPTAESLRAIQRVGRSTLTDLRGLLGALGEDPGDAGVDLAPAPRLGDAPALVVELGGAGLDVDLRLEGDVDVLPSGVGVAAYRILQEALTNAFRHARGSRVLARVSVTGDAVTVEVRNGGSRDGAVRTARLDGAGRGLVGMRERARLYGGEVVSGPDGDGFRVVARIPLGGTGLDPGVDAGLTGSVAP